MNNAIVVIDSSSDEEEPPLKKMKTSNTLESIQIGEIKTLVQKDIVVIDDEEEVVEVKEKDPLAELKPSEAITITEKSPKKEIIKPDIRKRVEISPVIMRNEAVSNDNFADIQLITEKESNNNIFEHLFEPSTSSNNEKSNIEVQENGVSSTSEEKSNEIIEEFELFLGLCRNCDYQSEHKELIERKLPKLQEKYNQANEKYVKSNFFKKLLLDTISKMKRKPSNIILFFCEVYKELGSQKKKTIVISDKDSGNLQKLQLVLKKIQKKIHQLEQTECNWDDESNSEYLMLDRYKIRATLVHKKICSIINENPYASRQIYKNLDISCSKYPEINRAVDKLYSKNRQFPSFYDIDRCIRKCVKQNNLVISDSVLVSEISKVFKHVGELLKRRRKLETYECLNDLVEPTEETEDPELEALLDKRHIENEKRIDEVIEKFSVYQDEVEEPNISSHSDDSNHESNDSSDE